MGLCEDQLLSWLHGWARILFAAKLHTHKISAPCDCRSRTAEAQKCQESPIAGMTMTRALLCNCRMCFIIMYTSSNTQNHWRSRLLPVQIDGRGICSPCSRSIKYAVASSNDTGVSCEQSFPIAQRVSSRRFANPHHVNNSNRTDILPKA